MTYDIYCWTNTITKKSYIGYTGQGILFRWKKHILNAMSGVDSYFYRSIRTYGVDVWICKELTEAEDQSEAERLETFYIESIGTLAPNGYNSTEGGDGGNTWYGSRVEERKKLISELTSGDRNPRYSGFTDEDILRAAVDLFEQDGSSWSVRQWSNLCRDRGYPLHLTSFRFSKFGGGSQGFRTALIEKLSQLGHQEVDLSYRATDSHKAKASAAHKGKVWATNIETGKSKLTEPSLVDGITIIKGRNIKC